MTPSHSQDGQGWEDRFNLIWSRAEIPEYANDAKFVLKSLISTVEHQARLAAQQELVADQEAGKIPYYNMVLEEARLAVLSRVREGLPANTRTPDGISGAVYNAALREVRDMLSRLQAEITNEPTSL